MKKHALVNLDYKHQGWASLSVACLRLPDGKLIYREIEDHGSAVAVLPYDAQRKTVVLVEQFRPAPFISDGQEKTLEAVAGILDEADCAAAARREAMEEAGLQLGKLEYVATTWTMPGISTEKLTLYLAPYAATDRVAAGGGLDAEDENIRVVEMSAADFAALMAAGDLVDMKTLALAQALQLRHPEIYA
ncbi:NUDIX domain-containing protein [Methylocystis parvus]|uniref:GDP-mannose pyrophosphatase n=1 Tax=Methylocystis parvus TaxID=134 RepID=A0A6B8MAE6_9HYPH|nr:NUDIX domain-containing protein [Methylocystis parvus]QGM98722.1 NUDIX domain-containing protein [Methylocystis parvus]WBK00929.1 NUDIX domain-containing protein [Methylocystis parvus OBBP]